MSVKSISVIVATLLKSDLRAGNSGATWLESALSSVMAQDILANRGWKLEVVVGLDAKAPEPGIRILQKVRDLIVPGVELRWIRALRPGRAAAANVAVQASTGGVLAFIDDDDRWNPRWLETATFFLDKFDLVSSSQAMFDLSGKVISTFDFAVPSTWVMRRGVWEAVRGMDNEFWCHADTDLLGKVNMSRVRRIHIVESGARARESAMLQEIARRSSIAELLNPNLLVTRAINPLGITETIRRSPSAQKISMDNHEKMLDRYGYYPS